VPWEDVGTEPDFRKYLQEWVMSGADLGMPIFRAKRAVRVVSYFG
jgi:hypothetical protein